MVSLMEQLPSFVEIAIPIFPGAKQPRHTYSIVGETIINYGWFIMVMYNNHG
jgi:hypothetical protein